MHWWVTSVPVTQEACSCLAFWGYARWSSLRCPLAAVPVRRLNPIRLLLNNIRYGLMDNKLKGAPCVLATPVSWRRLCVTSCCAWATVAVEVERVGVRTCLPAAYRSACCWPDCIPVPVKAALFMPSCAPPQARTRYAPAAWSTPLCGRGAWARAPEASPPSSHVRGDTARNQASTDRQQSIIQSQKRVLVCGNH